MVYVYIVFGNDGTVFEPVHRSMAEAQRMRHNASMRDPSETHVKRLVFAKFYNKPPRARRTIK